MAYKLYSDKYKRVKRFVYRGFLIEILDNRYFGRHRYEYHITALRSGIIIWRRKDVYTRIRAGDEFHDPTSMTSIKYSVIYAKDHVDGLCRPQCLRNIDY